MSLLTQKQTCFIADEKKKHTHTQPRYTTRVMKKRRKKMSPVSHDFGLTVFVARAAERSRAPNVRISLNTSPETWLRKAFVLAQKPDQHSYMPC